MAGALGFMVDATEHAAVSFLRATGTLLVGVESTVSAGSVDGGAVVTGATGGAIDGIAGTGHTSGNLGTGYIAGTLGCVVDATEHAAESFLHSTGTL
jgi:hypothetical protein